ncbi:MAG TPA: hypothetical protein VFJ57_02925 [Solirubrobacterales bacterium]|nr:hypothetical protein [Solirubrobacterales bacterium]
MAGVRKKRYPRTKEGDELTPEVIEALADEAERGYDLSKAKREFISRPLSGDLETMGKVGFRISNDELVRLSKQARAEDRTINSLIHEATMKYLESRGA